MTTKQISASQDRRERMATLTASLENCEKSEKSKIVATIGRLRRYEAKFQAEFEASGLDASVLDSAVISINENKPASKPEAKLEGQVSVSRQAYYSTLTVDEKRAFAKGGKPAVELFRSQN